MYNKVSRALNAVDSSLKFGTDANAGLLTRGPCREGLFDHIKAHNVPFDFYSSPTYADSSYDPYDVVHIGQETRRILYAKGFPKVESILSEWNLSADFTHDEESELSSMLNAAFIGEVLMHLQDSPVDFAHLYRGDALWMGLFNKTAPIASPRMHFELLA